MSGLHVAEQNKMRSVKVSPRAKRAEKILRGACENFVGKRYVGRGGVLVPALRNAKLFLEKRYVGRGGV